MCVPVSNNIKVKKQQSKCQPPVPIPYKDKQLPRLNKCRTSSENKTDNYQNKFVDAPLPKTNPWTVNRNAVQVVQPKDSTREKDAIVDKVQILQMPQQSIGEYYY